jgi:hypothetical protein
MYIFKIVLIVLLLVGMSAIGYGSIDMARASGDGKMGGAMLCFFGAGVLAVDFILFIVWAVIK